MTIGEQTLGGPEGEVPEPRTPRYAGSGEPGRNGRTSRDEPPHRGPLPADPLFERFESRARMEQSTAALGQASPTLVPMMASTELGHYIDILRRRWVWFLLPVFALTTLVAAFNLRSTDTFSSSALVLVNASEAGQVVGGAASNAGVSERQVENEIAFAKSDDVSSLASETLVDFDGLVTISGSEQADLLEFTVEASDPVAAADAANVWATAFVTAKQQLAIASTKGLTQSFKDRLATLSEERQALRSELDRIEDELAGATDPIRTAQLDLERGREERRITFELELIDAEVRAITAGITELQINGELVAAGEYRVIQVAAPADTPINLPLGQSLAFGVVAGLIVGAGSALLRDSLDQRIRSLEDVQALGLTPLATIPRVEGRIDKDRLAVLSLQEPEHPISIAYHRLRTVLEFNSSTRHFTSLLVTSPSQGEGKTTTAINLACSLALGGDFTAIVEADLRRPRFAEIYGISPQIGITSYLAGRLSFEDLGTHPTAVDNLVVVPGGPLPAIPSTTIGDPSFKDMLGLIEKDADIVVVDSPPVLPVPDALDLAHLVDGVLLVARAGKTKSSELIAAHENLRKVSANILGVVLTHGKDKSSQYRYEQEQPHQGLTGRAQWVRSKFTFPTRPKSR